MADEQPKPPKPNINDILADAVAERMGKRPQRELRFHPKRRWLFDLAFPKQKLAVEIDGSMHLSQKAQRNDCEKRNAALEMGWRVLSYPANCLLTKSRLPLIVEQIARVLCSHSEPRDSAQVLTGSLR